MKKIKDFIKNNIISIIFVILVSSTLGVYAASIAASNTTYSYSKTSQTTVKGALDELITKVENDPFKGSTLSSKYRAVGYSGTSNINLTTGDAGSGSYDNNLQTKDYITIPGATKLHVKLTYKTEYSYDYVYVFTGKYTGSVAPNMSAGQLKTYTGGSPTTVEFDVTSDTLTFAFYSDGSTSAYGYYAIVTNASTIDSMSAYTADLNSLVVKSTSSGSVLSLSPSFDPDTTNYYVTGTVDWKYNGTVYITATPIAGATVSRFGSGEYSSRGENPISFSVTSANGERTKTYKVNVTVSGGSS